jgi:hypothetical protein
MEWMRNVYRILVRRPEWKRIRRKPRCRWEDNIKIYPEESECEDVDWNHFG